MDITFSPVISIDELEEAVNLQYGTSYDLRDVLFRYDYSNDSFKKLYFNADVDETWEYESFHAMNLVFGYLRDILPGHDSVLIDVSW